MKRMWKNKKGLIISTKSTRKWKQEFKSIEDWSKLNKRQEEKMILLTKNSKFLLLLKLRRKKNKKRRKEV